MNNLIQVLIHNSPLLYLTQSLWRDEAFSIILVQKPLMSFVTKLIFEPPLYYIQLHYWIKIFGDSEIAARSLSFAAFILSIIVIIFWAEKLFKKSWLSIMLPVLFFLNPMLLYYAFEIRAYGWYMLWATISIYAYIQKKPKIYAISTVLGFYTHTYFIFVFLVQLMHYILWNRNKFFNRKTILKIFHDPLLISLIITGILILPQLTRIFLSFGNLNRGSWYFPVGFNLVKSALGNMFLGYEGTPWYLWKYTAWLSLILIAFSLLALKNKKRLRESSYIFLSIYIPLYTVIAVSLKKPLYVNRYLLPVTIAQVIMLSFALETIKNKFASKIIGLLILVSLIWFNIWYPNKHAKVPIRESIIEINRLKKNTDLIYAKSPLIFFETLYYSRDKSSVYLYNPTGYIFPWYVGNLAFSSHYMTSTLPKYPFKAYMVNEDGSYTISYTVQQDSPTFPP